MWTLWESKNCEGLNKHTHAYLLSPTSPPPIPFSPCFSFSLPLLMTKVAFQSISGRDSVQGEGFHLIHIRDTGWQVLHVKSWEGIPSVGIANALALHRQTERRSICEESWVMCMWGKRQHSILNVCEKRHLFHLCQLPLKLPLVWCTGLISFSCITNDGKLTILWLWSIVCCWTLY